MTWVKIDDRFDEHPKVIAAGPLGLALQVRAFCYCARNLTDGFLSDAIVRRLTLDLEPHPETMADLMVQAGLWERREGGFVVHDYLDFNPSRVDVLGAQEQRREAGRRGGRVSGERRSGNRSETEATRLGFASRLLEAKPNPLPVPLPDPQERVFDARALQADLTEQPTSPTVPVAPLPVPAVSVPVPDLAHGCPLCLRLLRRLNDLTTRGYSLVEPGGGWLHLAHTRFGVQACEGLIDRKCREWLHDRERNGFLALKVLFKPKNVEQWIFETDGDRGESTAPLRL